MPQENNELSWYEAFQRAMKPIFSKQEFDNHIRWVQLYAAFFRDYIAPDARILDCGCGLGCMAVSLSAMGYEVIGIDNDPHVVKAARQNARNFGKRIDIVRMDIKNIDKAFQQHEFDICVSGGVMEHFPKQQILDLLSKQLYCAPLVFMDVPIYNEEDPPSYKDSEKKICGDGIYRNLWTAAYWTDEILIDFTIISQRIGYAPKLIGGFKELLVLLKTSYR
jgi:SAM-dependent methyltransferase